MTKSLNNKDVGVVRNQLYEEQNGVCKLTGQKIEKSDAVLDHNHQNQFVRGVLHRQANAALGKIENIFIRFLKWWYKGDLSDFLRQAADYIDTSDDRRFYHPGWKLRATRDFRYLSEGNKDKVLMNLGLPKGNNSLVRSKLFVKSLKFTDYDTIKNAMKGLE
jgi:hypothetical protein